MGGIDHTVFIQSLFLVTKEEYKILILGILNFCMKSMIKYFGRFLYNSFSAASTGEFNRNTAVNTGEKCSKPCICQVWTQ